MNPAARCHAHWDAPSPWPCRQCAEAAESARDGYLEAAGRNAKAEREAQRQRRMQEMPAPEVAARGAAACREALGVAS